LKRRNPRRSRVVGPRLVSPVLTFVSYHGGHFYECQNHGDTRNYMILVWL
jgi:hypothetical protein